MKRTLTFFVVAATAALAACNEPKPREVQPAPAAPEPAAPASSVKAPASAGLAKRTEMATFTLDKINDQSDPYNTPATVAASAPMTFQGFIFDPVDRASGKAADLVIDGTPYGADYGHTRQDVADYFKNPAVAASGFLITLPAGLIAPGRHTAVIRMVSSDGASYFDSAPITFEVR